MLSNDTTDAAATRTGPTGSTLDELARALWRRRLWLILPVLFAGGLTAAWLSTVTPLYRSTVTVLIESQETAFTRPERSTEERSVLDQEAVRSQEQLILSRDLNRQVVQRLDLASEPEFAPGGGVRSLLGRLLSSVGITRDREGMSTEERVLDVYYDHLTVYQIDRSRVLAVEFRSQDPALAARVANAVADGYIEMQRSVKRDATVQASTWLSGEIERLRGRVEEAERRVEEYRRETGLYGSGETGEGGRSLTDQQLSELTSQLAVARSTRSDAQARARLIREMLDEGAPLEASDVLNSPLIQRVNEQQVRIRAQLAELSSSLGPRHPRIRELNSELADLRVQGREEAERLVRSLENDARVAAQNETELLDGIAALKLQAGDANEQEVVLRTLEREARTQRELLETMLSRFSEASTRDSFAALPTDARIISRASPASEPFFPKAVPILLTVMLATAMLGGGVIVTFELMRLTATGPMMGVPAAVAAAPASLRAQIDLEQDEEAHAFRPAPLPNATRTRSYSARQSLDAIAAAIAGPAGSDIARTVLATSARRLPEETAEVALRLARLLAEEGRHVVLVDTRFGETVAGLEGQSEAGGLAALLYGSCTFEEALVRDAHSRVHVVPAGQTSNDPLMLVSSSRMDVILQALGETYDVVIVLVPPVGRRVEARVLARYADFAVVATRSRDGETALERARGRLSDAGVEEIAVVAVDRPMGRGDDSLRDAA